MTPLSPYNSHLSHYTDHDVCVYYNTHLHHIVFRVYADAQLFLNVLEFEFMDIDLGLPLNVLN